MHQMVECFNSMETIFNLSWVINGDDIGSGLSSMAVCFDFRSSNMVQLNNQNPSTGFDVITHY